MNCLNAKTTITTSEPHKRIDRNNIQPALLAGGNADSAGGVGKGGMAGKLSIGKGSPRSKSKGRLNNSDMRTRTTCPIKKSTLIRKLINVPSREKSPRLSPDGSTLAITARMKR